MTVSRSRVPTLATGLVVVAGVLLPAVVTAQDPYSAALQRAIVRLDLGHRNAPTAPYLLVGVGGYDWGEEKFVDVTMQIACRR
jgi:hypothetical protein